MIRRILAWASLAIGAAFLVRAAMIGSASDRVPAIMLLVGWAGCYVWVRFTQSGQRVFAALTEQFKRKD
jgi:hypothetical protein